jgi:hypothetical protein
MPAHRQPPPRAHQCPAAAGSWPHRGSSRAWGCRATPCPMDLPTREPSRGSIHTCPTVDCSRTRGQETHEGHRASIRRACDQHLVRWHAVHQSGASSSAEPGPMSRTRRGLVAPRRRQGCCSAFRTPLSAGNGAAANPCRRSSRPQPLPTGTARIDPVGHPLAASIPCAVTRSRG